MNTPESDDSPLSPEEFIEALHALQARIPDVSPLTAEERLVARRQARLSEETVNYSLSLIGMTDTIADAVGSRPDAAREIVTDRNRWTKAQLELKAMLSVIADANLVRAQRVAILATRAYLIAQQLARGPEGVDLRYHLEEIKRLRAAYRKRKKKVTTER